VKNPLRCDRRLLVAVGFTLLHSNLAFADGVNAEPPEADESGFNILSNATNVTRWGLGGGLAVGQTPYKGYGIKTSPIPLISFDDKWVHALGTTVDVKVGTWDHLSVALRGQFEIGDGYTGADAPILTGMHNRKGAFWYGPALSWNTQFGTLSGDFLLGGNKGQQANIDFSKSFSLGAFSVTPHAGVEWLSDKYVNYYYGVMPSEAEVGRPAYTGQHAYDESIGTRVDYRLTSHQSVQLDFTAKHLRGGITDSPLVGKRYLPELRIGYLYRFN